MTVKSVIRNFLETTSIKGVSKATKSHVRFLRISWTVCIIFGLSMTVYFMYNTMMEYYRYEYTTNFKEKRVSPPFPDTTICKINPILFKDNDKLGYQEYMKVLESHNAKFKNNNSGYSLKEKSLMKDFLMDLTGRVGYFQYTNGKNNLQMFNNSFIINCEMALWTGQSMPCSNHILQEPLFLQPDTPLCVKLSPDLPYSSSIQSIQVIIFIDDNRCDEDTDLSVQNLLTVGADGVFVLPHGSATEPTKFDGIRVPPGVEMDVGIKAHNFQRLDNPFSNCTTHTNTSDEVCLLTCAQMMAINKCKCLDPYLPTTFQQRLDYSFCGNVSAEHSLFKGRVKCLLFERKWNEVEEFCTGKCFPPCTETKYELHQASSRWPHEIFRTVLYSFVKDNPALTAPLKKEIFCSIKNDKDTKIFGESFDSLEDQDDERNETNDQFDCNSSLFVQLDCPKESNQDPISRNFLKVNIMMTKRLIDVSVDTPKVSLFQVYGTVGGTLNLWIGITFVTLIELAELLYNLIKDRLEEDQVQNISSAQEKEVPK